VPALTNRLGRTAALGMVKVLNRRTHVLRAAPVLTAGAFGVHQLRYALGSGADPAHHHAHGVLTVLAPVVALLLAAALAHVLWAAMRPPGGTAPTGPGFRRSWLLTSTSLVIVYTGQELLEGFVADGHPAGLLAIYGAGGWMAVPLALLIGAFVAAALRLSRAVDSAAPPRLARVPRPQLVVAPALAIPADCGPRPFAAPLALRRAGRAPPRRR
jgi:hypothetical protein